MYERYTALTGKAPNPRFVEVVRDKVGVETRWLSGRSAVDLGLEAASLACADAAANDPDFDPTKIKLILGGGSTPDYAYPALANRVQHHLGIPAFGADGFDILAACATFGQAARIAAELMLFRGLTYALVVLPEPMLSAQADLRQEDAVLWGDGAGAIVLKCSDSDSRQSGVLLSAGGMDGLHVGLAYSAGLGAHANLGDVRHATLTNGPALQRYVLEHVPDMIRCLLVGAGMIGSVGEKLSAEQSATTWLLPHNANASMCARIGERIGLGPDRVLTVLADRGNTSSASIIITLERHARLGTFKSGDRLILTSFGAGITANAILYIWP